MSQVLVWKSDYDGKLFEDKAKYNLHLRKLARVRADQRKVAKMEALRNDFVTNIGQVKSISELTQFIKDNWDWFYTNGKARNAWRSTKKTAKHEYFSIGFNSMRFGDQSNSHYCPKNGVTNWGGNKVGAPTSYPGWRGTIVIKVKTQQVGKYYKDGFGSDYFANTIICTGGGGGGGVKDGVTSYSYEVILWADDFPEMTKRMEQEKTWEALGAQIKGREYAIY